MVVSVAQRIHHQPLLLAMLVVLLTDGALKRRAVAEHLVVYAFFV